MNVPDVCDAILACLEAAKPETTTIYDGGVITPNPTDEFIEFLGTEDGVEEPANLGNGPNSRRRPYSLGLVVGVAVEGLDAEITKQVRDRAFEIYEQLRIALIELDIVSIVPSVEAPLQLDFQFYNPGFTTVSRTAYVGALIRVVER